MAVAFLCGYLLALGKYIKCCNDGFFNVSSVADAMPGSFVSTSLVLMQLDDTVSCSVAPF